MCNLFKLYNKPFLKLIILTIGIQLEAKGGLQKVFRNKYEAHITTQPYVLYPRVNMGMEYFIIENMSVSMDIGYGNQHTYLNLLGLHSIKRGDKYFAFEVNPEIKFYTARRVHNCLYYSLDLFYLSAWRKYTDPYGYNNFKNNERTNFHSATHTKNSYGAHFKLGYRP